METLSPPHRTSVVFAGGEMTVVPPPHLDGLVIAADSGYDNARAHGIAVSILVGDLDSISSEGLDHARSSGVEIQEHPVDKDHTDFELALDVATARHSTHVEIYGGEGGRLDHLLGLAAQMTAEGRSHLLMSWHTGQGTVQPVLGGTTLQLTVSTGTTVSLIAVTDASGVTTTGLRWSLSDENLLRGTTRAMSNTTTDENATVSIDTGALLVITESSP